MSSEMSENRIKVDMIVPEAVNGQGGIARVAAVIQGSYRNSAVIDIRVVQSRLSSQRIIRELFFPYVLASYCLRMVADRPDAMHLHLSIRGSTLRKICFGVLARLFSVPYIIHLHGSAYDEFYAQLPSAAKRTVRRFFTRASKVIVLGSHWRDHVIEDIGVSAERVALIENAVPDFGYDPDRKVENDPLILFVGEVGRRKGTHILMEALAREELRVCNWSAIIVGEGNLDELRRQRESLGLEKLVKIAGWLPPAEVEVLLRRACIFVLPSTAENQPMSIIEAMAAGVPVVSTPVGAIPEMIESGNDGILVPTGNVDAVVTAIVQLLASRELRLRLSRRARQIYLSRFTPAVQALKLTEIYKSVSGRN